MVQIMPVENGFVITAHHDQKERNQEAANIFSSIVGAIGKSEDPAAAFKKAVDQIQLKEAVRRKPVEHHVAKNIDEVIKLLAEILGSMK